MSVPSTNEDPRGRKGFTYALRKQAHVISALLIRETKTRFGRQRIGFLWAFLEPLAYISIFLFIHGYLRSSVPFGEDALLFLISGVLAFRTYISIASRTMNAISSNKSLLTYPVVRPLDVIFARIMLEAMVMLVVGGISFGFIAYYLSNRFFIDAPEIVAALFATVYLGASVGTFNAVVSSIAPSWINIYSMLGLPMFISSAIFYVPIKLPPAVLNIIAWNPILHCVEWVRDSTYLSYFPVLDRSYVLTFATITFVSALVLERMNRSKIISQ